MDNSNYISLSWLVVSTRDYKKDYDWFWDKKHHHCYGILKSERTDNIVADLAKRYCNWNRPESYYEESVLMPELQDLDIEDAAAYIREWCDRNHILYKEDLDEYKQVEYSYWG